MNNIDEVTAFADEAAATLSRVVKPMLAGEEAGVDAIVHEERLVDPRHRVLQLHDEWRKSPVEADHHEGVRRVAPLCVQP